MVDERIFCECPNCGNDFSVELPLHDKQIRAEVIDEFEKAFCDNENQRSFITLNQHSHSWDSYAKHIAEQLKEMPSRKRKPADLTNKCGSCAWAQPRRGAYIDCTYPCKEPLICPRTKLKCKHYEHKEQKNE